MKYIALLLCIQAFAVQAHIPFYEPQALGQPDGDWSFETPFELPIDAEQGWSPELIQSRTITSVIGGRINSTSAGIDLYDVYTFTVAPGDEQYPVGIYTLVGGCDEDLYPAVALLGPVSDPRFNASTSAGNSTELPFEMPDGYGAITAVQPSGVERVYMDMYDALLPHPMGYECLTGGPEGFVSEECGGGEPIISWLPGVDEPLVPGQYYIAVWDPERLVDDEAVSPRQLSVVVGYLEGATPQERGIQGESGAAQSQLVYACGNA